MDSSVEVRSAVVDVCLSYGTFAVLPNIGVCNARTGKRMEKMGGVGGCCSLRTLFCTTSHRNRASSFSKDLPKVDDPRTRA